MMIQCHNISMCHVFFHITPTDLFSERKTVHIRNAIMASAQTAFNKSCLTAYKK